MNERSQAEMILKENSNILEYIFYRIQLMTMGNHLAEEQKPCCISLMAKFSTAKLLNSFHLLYRRNIH